MKTIVLTVATVVLLGTTAIGGAVDASEALIEEASASSGLSAFQFLERGERLTLGAADRIVIGYPGTCLRETVIGGAVTIGDGISEVAGGEVARETFACGARVELSSAERQESGASAWRADPDGAPVLVHDLSPLLLFSLTPEVVLIERLDIPGRPIRISAPGRKLDLAAVGVTLEAGALYAVVTDAGSIKIEIDFDAATHGGPVVTRVVRF